MFWKILFQCEAGHAPEFGNALEDHVAAVSWFETAQENRWTVEALTLAQPAEKEVQDLLAPLCAALKIPLPSLVIEKAPNTDWLEATRSNFPPRHIGRYYIHGSHMPPCAQEGVISIELNAATAFGSGEHETTRGCLLTLDDLAAQGKIFLNSLDMGCGSGILAIAIAKTWHRRVVAADNDPESIRVATANALLNNCASLVQACESEGFSHRDICRNSPCDLIVANILANPLIEMAPSVSRFLAAGGIAILSGLLTNQVAGVADAYERENVSLVSRQAWNSWEVLVLEKR